MPISSGFTQDPKSNYYIRKPTNSDVLDESIYYRRDIPVPVEKPVEIKPTNRPIIKETVFLPDRGNGTQPIASNREIYSVSPEPTGPVYTVPNDPASKGSFNLIRALGLNADCPCWSWIVIVLGLIILLTLIAVALYFVLRREGRV